MEVKIKKLCETAVIPSYAKPGDAGMDLVATSRVFDKYGNVEYGTGLAMEIPEGYVGLIFARSSISKQDLSLANAVGVIDSGYRGEVTVKFKPSVALDKGQFCTYIRMYGLYNIGDRVAQMIILPYPHIEFEETNDLSETERGDGGYGSTDK